MVSLGEAEGKAGKKNEEQQPRDSERRWQEVESSPISSLTAFFQLVGVRASGHVVVAIAEEIGPEFGWLANVSFALPSRPFG